MTPSDGSHGPMIRRDVAVAITVVTRLVPFDRTAHVRIDTRPSSLMTDWFDLGPVERFTGRPLSPARIGKTKIAVTCVNGEFGVLSGVCNHAGGPLADGRMDGDYVVCPWHNWKYHRRTGLGEPGFEADAVPSYSVRVENGHLFVSAEPATKRTRGVH